MSIRLEHLVKTYEGHPVVNDVSLEVEGGEFFVLLGPSGSGKSTVLRMIAGLTDADSGRVVLHGRDVTDLPPQRRGVGFVFQHYALFRHLSVAENVEFALRIRSAPVAERQRRREELLELVGLAGLGGRMPSQLSGGQQQRVALARALAHQPEVLLLDEPFGALDARIRLELRRTVRQIQRELRITTLFVTHDQEEAFELADRLGVLHFGHLLESGPPDELYLRPQTEFVATFLGTANLIVGEASAAGVRVGPLHFPLSTQANQTNSSRRVQVLFRPEDVAVKDSPEALSWPLLGKAVVEQSAFIGPYERLRLRLPKIAGLRPIAPAVPFGGDFLLIEASRSQHQARRFPLHPGDDAWVGVRRIHALAHPGLSFLMTTDGSVAAQAALAWGGALAQRAHARVSILAHSGEEAQNQIQGFREQFGSGLAALETRSTNQPLTEALAEEAERRDYDLIVLGMPAAKDLELADRLLAAGEHRLLLVRQPSAPPTRVLICVAVGEPGKEDVRFAARLLRHLGAEATVLTVLPQQDPGGPSAARAERFLGAAVRTLSQLGVRAQVGVRRGAVRQEIRAELREGGYGLLVVGAPLPGRTSRGALSGLLGQLLPQIEEMPVLIVRSRREGS
jgi:sulfate transport system ATP-binding protein